MSLGCSTPEPKKDPVKFEGVWNVKGDPTFEKISEELIAHFLPYNPTIIAIKNSKIEEALLLARNFPKGRVIVFEPNAKVFNKLLGKFSQFANLFVFHEEILKFSLSKSNINLDTWCNLNDYPKVDLIRLDSDGLELKILRSSPQILKTTSVIFTKTNTRYSKKKLIQFSRLKHHLSELGFILLSHWYYDDSPGDAVFIRKDIYDSIYN